MITWSDILKNAENPLNDLKKLNAFISEYYNSKDLYDVATRNIANVNLPIHVYNSIDKETFYVEKYSEWLQNIGSQRSCTTMSDCDAIQKQLLKSLLKHMRCLRGHLNRKIKNIFYS